MERGGEDEVILGRGAPCSNTRGGGASTVAPSVCIYQYKGQWKRACSIMAKGMHMLCGAPQCMLIRDNCGLLFLDWITAAVMCVPAKPCMHAYLGVVDLTLFRQLEYGSKKNISKVNSIISFLSQMRKYFQLVKKTLAFFFCYLSV